MKKTTPKLILRREGIRILRHPHLADVAGGVADPPNTVTILTDLAQRPAGGK